MTAKEKQTGSIQTFLKPTLKQIGYMTPGQTWWKDKGNFFNFINLQNYSWNSKDISQQKHKKYKVGKAFG